MNIDNFINELEQQYNKPKQSNAIIKPPEVIKRPRFAFKITWRLKGSKDKWTEEKELLKVHTKQEAINQNIFLNIQHPERIYSFIEVRLC